MANPPEGARCMLCGRVGPVDHMAYVSREFDVSDPEFVRLSAGLPEKFIPETGTVRLAVLAHKEECP